MFAKNSKKTDTKSQRRLTNNKLLTVIKKSFELSHTSCEVLLIVHFTATKNWYQYSSTDSSSLFFGFENAKKNSEQAESYNNTDIHRLIQDCSAEEKPRFPEPIKKRKINESDSEKTQPAPVTEKFDRDSRTSQGVLSTDCSFKSLNNYLKSTSKPPDINPEKINPLHPIDDHKSSPSFSFEDYFVA